MAFKAFLFENLWGVACVCLDLAEAHVPGPEPRNQAITAREDLNGCYVVCRNSLVIVSAVGRQLAARRIRWSYNVKRRGWGELLL